MFKANHSSKLNGKNTFKGDNIQNILKKKKKNPGEGNGNPLHGIPWRIPWTEEPGRLQSMGLQESDAI